MRSPGNQYYLTVSPPPFPSSSAPATPSSNEYEHIELASCDIPLPSIEHDEDSVSSSPVTDTFSDLHSNASSELQVDPHRRKRNRHDSDYDDDDRPPKKAMRFVMDHLDKLESELAFYKLQVDQLNSFILRKKMKHSLSSSLPLYIRRRFSAEQLEDYIRFSIDKASRRIATKISNHHHYHHLSQYFLKLVADISWLSRHYPNGGGLVRAITCLRHLSYETHPENPHWDFFRRHDEEIDRMMMGFVRGVEETDPSVGFRDVYEELEMDREIFVRSNGAAFGWFRGTLELLGEREERYEVVERDYELGH